MVSVITSVYNCEQYLEEMINSIIGQSYGDWELIIVDDASDDDTWEIISSYSDKRIVKIRNDKNEGLTVNLNKAWNVAKGEYLARIDGDDVAYFGRLQKQVEYMDNHPHTVVLGGGMTLIGDKHMISEPNGSTEINKVGLLFDAVIGHPTMMLRREVLEKNSIRYNEFLRYAQDYDLEYRASQVGDISAISECVIKYRIHNKQLTNEKATAQKQCADYTRKKVLSDLQISLTEKEFGLWSDLCTWNRGVDDDSIHIMENIINQIVDKNRTIKLYDERLLRMALEQRLNYTKESEQYDNHVVENKYEYMFQTQYKWMENVRKGKNISRWMYQRSVRSVAIYGAGFLGKSVVNEMLEEGLIDIEYIMDSRIAGEYLGIDIINDFDKTYAVDAVIVTVILRNEEICNRIKTMGIGEVYLLDDLVHEVSLS